jgi:catechol-2,3-dioxygenase
MDADRDSNAPRPEISAHVASCVIRVRELDPSLKFYCDVFSYDVAVRETDMALLVTPERLSHLRACSLAARPRGQHRRGPIPAVGHRH